MADYTAVGTPDKKEKWQWCLWGSRIPIRALTCWFLGEITEVSGKLDTHGVVAVVRPDAEHSRCDAAADPR
jgi:hypothetical protein